MILGPAKVLTMPPHPGPLPRRGEGEEGRKHLWRQHPQERMRVTPAPPYDAVGIKAKAEGRNKKSTDVKLCRCFMDSLSWFPYAAFFFRRQL